MQCFTKKSLCADVVLKRHQVTYLGAGVVLAGVKSEAAGPAPSSIVQKQHVELDRRGESS